MPHERRLAARVVLATVLLLVSAAALVWTADRAGILGGQQQPPAAGATHAAPAVACGAQPPPPAAPKLYKAPQRVMQRGIDYSAVISTSCGDIRLDLLEDQAPRSVNSFIFLAQEGFYNGLTWHQVVHDFIIQTGDPNGANGKPPDGPGYTVPDESPKQRNPYTYGVVGLANTGRTGTGGSQFFIVVHDFDGAVKGRPEPLRIDRTYSVFGRVPRRFFGSVENIARQPTVGGSDPIESVKPKRAIYVESITIVEHDKRTPARPRQPVRKRK